MRLIQAGWLLTLLLSANSMLQAADVNITVKGKVVAKPCTVSTPKATVELGDLLTFNFVNAGSASPGTTRHLT